MEEKAGKVKIIHSDKLQEIIQSASKDMSFDEYADATGLDKEFIFRILNGTIEEVDEETTKKLSLKH